MVQRQIPKPAEILDLMTFKKFELDPKKRRLESALTIDDLRTIAKRRTPAAAFDYTDGAAEGEIEAGHRLGTVEVPPAELGEGHGPARLEPDDQTVIRPPLPRSRRRAWRRGRRRWPPRSRASRTTTSA